MKLTWKHAARLDRLAIFEFIAADNMSAAVELDHVFDQKARQLLDMPHSGRKGRMRQTRELVIHPNYLLIYRLNPAIGSVEILRVLHAAQKWP
ncbi:type II toxin-antitoxin system RelE/ParE family toxin [Asticcacaulis taihuensis]|uniref:type II toxin-antitoxin system RelE/ParE family toxin n=1 Tax=Asticcacaulis taihuensis TaxID=260084 RepID=UPI003F7CB6FA